MEKIVLALLVLQIADNFVFVAGGKIPKKSLWYVRENEDDPKIDTAMSDDQNSYFETISELIDFVKLIHTITLDKLEEIDFNDVPKKSAKKKMHDFSMIDSSRIDPSDIISSNNNLIISNLITSKIDTSKIAKRRKKIETNLRDDDNETKKDEESNLLKILEKTCLNDFRERIEKIEDLLRKSIIDKLGDREILNRLFTNDKKIPVDLEHDRDSDEKSSNENSQNSSSLENKIENFDDETNATESNNDETTIYRESEMTSNFFDTTLSPVNENGKISNRIFEEKMINGGNNNETTTILDFPEIETEDSKISKKSNVDVSTDEKNVKTNSTHSINEKFENSSDHEENEIKKNLQLSSVKNNVNDETNLESNFETTTKFASSEVNEITSTRNDENSKEIEKNWQSVHRDGKNDRIEKKKQVSHKNKDKRKEKKDSRLLNNSLEKLEEIVPSGLSSRRLLSKSKKSSDEKCARSNVARPRRRKNPSDNLWKWIGRQVILDDYRNHHWQ